MTDSMNAFSRRELCIKNVELDVRVGKNGKAPPGSGGIISSGQHKLEKERAPAAFVDGKGTTVSGFWKLLKYCAWGFGASPIVVEVHTVASPCRQREKYQGINGRRRSQEQNVPPRTEVCGWDCPGAAPAPLRISTNIYFKQSCAKKISPHRTAKQRRMLMAYVRPWGLE